MQILDLDETFIRDRHSGQSVAGVCVTYTGSLRQHYWGQQLGQGDPTVVIEDWVTGVWRKPGSRPQWKTGDNGSG
jgi:hypothetical protein